MWEKFGQEPSFWVFCWRIGNLKSFRQQRVNPLFFKGKESEHTELVVVSIFIHLFHKLLFGLYDPQAWGECLSWNEMVWIKISAASITICGQVTKRHCYSQRPLGCKELRLRLTQEDGWVSQENRITLGISNREISYLDMGRIKEQRWGY